jgi:carbonic anhydrase/acetyltransferase-like protein (isoleucine patch superfamily)
VLVTALSSTLAESKKNWAWVSLHFTLIYSEIDRLGCQMTNDISYLQETSRHRQVMPLFDAVPQTAESWIAPNAALVGDVFVSKWATVWYNVTIRAEQNPVRIGQFSSIGDGTSINTSHSLPAGVASSVNIGKNVTIEARCSIHSCIIDDDCIIGENSVVMQGARIERGAVILPNSVVPPGRLIPSG